MKKKININYFIFLKEKDDICVSVNIIDYFIDKYINKACNVSLYSNELLLIYILNNNLIKIMKIK